ncbi:MAG TPA: hypothetical protein DCQ15_02380 [Chitinophagaceae bacterium]|nr:hypothetical protein [Chitinophagaceae bacterium]HAZ93003.1 hypothetical protein [Chitinophagaceae bacterium]
MTFIQRRNFLQKVKISVVEDNARFRNIFFQQVVINTVGQDFKIVNISERGFQLFFIFIDLVT